jgi:hypothetical protein
MSDDLDKSADHPRRVRPGRIRAERSEGRGLLLRKLSARTQSRPKRSRTKGRALQRLGYGPGARQQRSVVKVQYVANRTPDGWRAHGRLESMLDHLALWLFVLLPAPRQREMEARQEAGRQSHGSWRLGARRLFDDGGPRIDRAERREGRR